MDSDERKDVNILVALPCALAREAEPAAIHEHVYINMKQLMFVYGPISFQKLVETLMERLARTDLKALAGEPFLMDIHPEGSA